nr:hypothetical protein [Tanacetum cinerariifolium]
EAREGFCSQIGKLSNIERETSIIINGEVDLGKTALYIAAEDDSLISHSSVPLPEAREGFCSQIGKLSNIERETSIIINGEVDLGKTALYIAAEDDSLISHSSVPLPVDAFISRLDDLSMGYCSRYSSSFVSSPDSFLESLERYLYVDKVHPYLISQ